MKNIDIEISELCRSLGAVLVEKKLTITTAESCTGGGIARALTDISGCSQWFHGAFVSYSNTCKHTMLGVDELVIESEGAVSKSVVCAMVEGAKNKIGANVAVAVSGIAGPGGAVPGKPVGTVWIAWAVQQKLTEASLYHFEGDRNSVRQQTIYAALAGVLQRLK